MYSMSLYGIDPETPTERCNSAKMKQSADREDEVERDGELVLCGRRESIL